MTRLFPLDSIPDPGAREARLDGNRIFVVRKGELAFGYVNSCPHVRAPLNMEEDAFLDMFKTSILCANHFALFEVETGLCTRGPCTGKTLKPVPLRLEDGWVVVEGGCLPE